MMERGRVQPGVRLLRMDREEEEDGKCISMDGY